MISGVSQRRSAIILRANRKTIIRKFQFMGPLAKQVNLFLGNQQPPAKIIEFDDLETFEHSKLKPISVTMAVESQTRRIIGFEVSQMPAKGLLVKKSLKKYGPRQDQRKQAREKLFQRIQSQVDPCAIIKSDENPHYGPDVKKYFPKAEHKTYKGRRGCVVGQGEIKAGGFDDIFSLNHTFAMLRANINRLFRRTWNTTKKKECLSTHIELYMLFHNMYIINNPSL